MKVAMIWDSPPRPSTETWPVAALTVVLGDVAEYSGRRMTRGITGVRFAFS
jgi:hypothetical protein